MKCFIDYKLDKDTIFVFFQSETHRNMKCFMSNVYFLQSRQHGECSELELVFSFLNLFFNLMLSEPKSLCMLVYLAMLDQK
jgi:hypothetical protein